MFNINIIWGCCSDLKQFLECLREALSKDLEETEQKYLACEQSDQLSAPPTKKRGRKRKSDKTFEQNYESSSAMAELAASLQISHFHKVCEP